MDERHGAWLDDCKANAADIASLLRRHADTPDDDEAVAPLFRNLTTPGIPARSGYWAGELIARRMLQNGYGLEDLLSLGPAEARDHVLDWAISNDR